MSRNQLELPLQIDTSSVLSEDGSVDQDFIPDLEDDFLQRLHRAMLLSRSRREGPDADYLRSDVAPRFGSRRSSRRKEHRMRCDRPFDARAAGRRGLYRVGSKDRSRRYRARGATLFRTGGRDHLSNHGKFILVGNKLDVSANDLLEYWSQYPLLEGYRGKPAGDIDAFKDLMYRVATLAEEIDELVELDLNPVFVSPDGVTVADVRLAVRAAQ